MIDEASGATPQSDTVTGFSGGEYLVFEVTGNVLFRFTNLGGLNAVLSGVFFGGRAATTGSRYVYDVFGDRIEADDVAGGVTTVTRFGYDGSNVWADLNGSNALVTRYVRPDGEDQLAARVSAAGSAVAWYLTDRQGSTRALTNASGAVQDQLSYDAFGDLLSETDAAYGDRYKYTGREWDAADKLQYNRARYYDPATGSWTSQDPAGFDAGDDDLYRYVGNGPTDRTDPSGMQPNYDLIRQARAAAEKAEAEAAKRTPSGPVRYTSAEKAAIDRWTDLKIYLKDNKFPLPPPDNPPPISGGVTSAEVKKMEYDAHVMMMAGLPPTVNGSFPRIILKGNLLGPIGWYPAAIDKWLNEPPTLEQQTGDLAYSKGLAIGTYQFVKGSVAGILELPELLANLPEVVKNFKSVLAEIRRGFSESDIDALKNIDPELYQLVSAPHYVILTDWQKGRLTSLVFLKYAFLIDGGFAAGKAIYQVGEAGAGAAASLAKKVVKAAKENIAARKVVAAAEDVAPKGWWGRRPVGVEIQEFDPAYDPVVRPPAPKGLPLASGDLVIDSNAAIVLRKASLHPGKTIDELVAIGVLQPGEGASLRALQGMNKNLRIAGTVAAEVKDGVVSNQLALSVERTSVEYKSLVEELKVAKVGAGKGIEDRTIVADVFFAKTESGVVPTFATQDKGIINKLYALTGKDPQKLGKPVSEVYTDGFFVTVGGRTIKVVPLPTK